ncbi:prevent-host-death family protein [Mycobacterium bohemicum DSM 44277]|uniref:Antitoxin n=2 Tax=Mycobacterium bohemicum TaxID=56425 RepID=A0A1X1RFA2_MYCBE|nr:type II toxin-antitoxin system Phd/YefM family antitoxin [Mycobacterium bohemicum]ORV04514.1 hypothetical protein AWB93_00820 [Mycobacterium bohemicum]CPR04284.1 prevent-host-death family protein [Mycobacterium bohemicum DSM 44277]
MDTQELKSGNNAQTMPLTEVRDNIKTIIDEVVETATEYTITRHGKPVAVILSFEEYESLVETLNILSDDDTMAAIAEGEAELDG